MIKIKDISISNISRPSGIAEGYICLMELARATIIIEIDGGENSILFDDVPVLVTLKDMLYGIITSRLLRLNEFVVDTPDLDESTVYGVENSTITNLQIHDGLGVIIRRVELKSAITEELVFSLILDILRKCDHVISDFWQSILFDPILRRAFKEIKNSSC